MQRFSEVVTSMFGPEADNDPGEPRSSSPRVSGPADRAANALAALNRDAVAPGCYWAVRILERAAAGRDYPDMTITMAISGLRLYLPVATTNP